MMKVVLFAVLVALTAGFVHFVLFRNNGLIWSLRVLGVVLGSEIMKKAKIISAALPVPT